MNELKLLDAHAEPLEALIRAAKAAGATAAAASISGSEGLTVGTRLGKLEECEQSESQSLSLRVYVGQRSAAVTTNDLRALDANALAQRAVTIARASTEDEYAGLANPGQLAREAFPLDQADPDFTLDQARLQKLAEVAEQAALDTHGIVNSRGASSWASRGHYSLLNTAGFAASEESTAHGIAVTAIAADGEEAMVVDSDHASKIYASDLPAPESIGQRAAVKALRQRASKKIASLRDVSVVFDPEAARSLLSHFLGAISGGAIAQGQSFLVDKLGAKVFSDGIAILDEPQLPRGLRSRSFDAEGLPTRPLPLVQDGVLRHYNLSLRSARQLQLAPNGRASGSGNVSLQPGSFTPAELMRDIGRGLYVTSLMGSVNTVTGDYSRGVVGLLIEDGELAGAVSEVTIAGTLQHIYSHLTAANDLVRRFGIDSPTVRVDGLTLSGK